jgi:serine/threonine protein kinase
MILMEYCDRGSLRDLLGTRQQVLSEDQISVIMQDLLEGLQLMQTEHRIIHRQHSAVLRQRHRDRELRQLAPL